MTTQRRITRPGPTDNEFMTVTCTPDETAVEFFEFQEEAEDAARQNLHPTTTTYVGKVLKQGQHAVRGSSKHIAICVEIDPELQAALRKRFGCRSRKDIAEHLDSILHAHLEEQRFELRPKVGDDEVTQTMAPAKAVTPETLTDKQIHEVLDASMDGSPLAESCLIALGNLVVDGSEDPEADVEFHRERICDAINARAGKEG